MGFFFYIKWIGILLINDNIQQVMFFLIAPLCSVKEKEKKEKCPKKYYQISNCVRKKMNKKMTLF